MADIIVPREKDKQILDLVLPHTLPDSEWVASQIQNDKATTTLFKHLQRSIRQEVNNTKVKNKQKLFMVKLANLKDKMIGEYVAQYATRRHEIIGIKNRVIDITQPRLNKYLLKEALDQYFSYSEDINHAYKNKIGVLKFNTNFSREFYLTTGKYPYEIH